MGAEPRDFDEARFLQCQESLSLSLLLLFRLILSATTSYHKPVHSSRHDQIAMVRGTAPSLGELPKAWDVGEKRRPAMALAEPERGHCLHFQNDGEARARLVLSVVRMWRSVILPGDG